VPELDSYDYAVIRVVPSVERGECINCGVILFSRTRGFLRALTHLDVGRLRAIDPHVDVDSLERHLEIIERICTGDESAGEIARLSPSERFHWLVAPRSAVIQLSEVHTGISADPEGALRHLLETMVLPARPNGARQSRS
jgi:hypothetical protein